MVKRIFLSGRFDVGTEIEKAWLKRTGCRYRCFTYANIDKNSRHHNKRVIESLAVCEKRHIHIMMDSGAASLHNIQASINSRTKNNLAKQHLDTTAMARLIFNNYAAYCLANKEKWTFFVTLDFKKHQPTIFKMHKKFERVGLPDVTPVFHGDASLDWLNKYADRGSTLVGVSSIASARNRHSPKKFRYYLDNVFNRAAILNLNLHGLAMTSLSLLTQYPWWSVDSAAWTKTASFGSILFPNVAKNTIENVHVSTRSSKSTQSYGKMTRKQKQEIASRVAELGFNIKLLRKDVKERHDFNGFIFSNLTKIGLDIKRKEGATWETLL